MVARAHVILLASLLTLKNMMAFTSGPISRKGMRGINDLANPEIDNKIQKSLSSQHLVSIFLADLDLKKDLKVKVITQGQRRGGVCVL